MQTSALEPQVNVCPQSFVAVPYTLPTHAIPLSQQPVGHEQVCAVGSQTFPGRLESRTHPKRLRRGANQA